MSRDVSNRSGLLLTREPFIANAIGRSFATSPLFTDLLNRTDGGTYEITGFYDGQPRLTGYKAVPGLPLVVLVSFSRAEVLAPWYHYLYTFGPMVAFVVVVILIGTFLLVRQTQKIADKSNVLELTLDNIAHGLVMVDGDLRLIVCNRRYAEMYGLPSELIRPGTPLRAILEARVVNGNGPPDAGEFVATRLQEVARTAHSAPSPRGAARAARCRGWPAPRTTIALLRRCMPTIHRTRTTPRRRTRAGPPSHPRLRPLRGPDPCGQ